MATLYYHGFPCRSVKQLRSMVNIHELVASYLINFWARLKREYGEKPELDQADAMGNSCQPPLFSYISPEEYVTECIRRGKGKIKREDFLDERGQISEAKCDDYLCNNCDDFLDRCETHRFGKQWGIIYEE